MGLATGLEVRSEYQLHRIALDDIDYIESVEDYIKIHRQGERLVLTLMTMNRYLLNYLPTDSKGSIGVI